MGVYSATTANAYADKIKAVYEHLGEIKKVADRLTPVEDLTAFQSQIESLYAHLDLLVEASNVIASATPVGEAILTGSVLSIQALLEIGVLPPDLVYDGELQIALDALKEFLLAEIDASDGQIEYINTRLNDYETYRLLQQAQIDGLQIDYYNAAAGIETNQTNIEEALSRLTVHEQYTVLQDERLDSISQSLDAASLNLAATNDIVAGHTADIATTFAGLSMHTASIDALNSTLTNVEDDVAANASALQEMETTITQMGDDITAQSAQTTQLKSAIGGSGNMLPNADFALDANGWEIVVAEDDWEDTILTTNLFNMPVEVNCLEVLGQPTPEGQIVVESPPMMIEGSNYYIVSGYPCVDNGLVELSYKTYDDADNLLDQGACPNTFNVTTQPFVSNYTRTWVKFQASEDATRMRLYLTVTGDGDWLVQGALFRPMVERAWIDQEGPSEWVPNTTGIPEALATAVQSLNTETTLINGELTALTEAQTALASRVDTSESALINEIITSANKDAAFSASINNLSSRMEDAELGLDAASSALTSLDTRVDTVEGTVSSHSSSLTSLQAQVDSMDEATGGSGAAISALDTRVTATEDAIESQSDAITALQSSVTSANKIFVQDTAPSTTGRTDGDLWIDTAHGNKPYTFDDATNTWVPRSDLNKNTIFVQPTAPAGTGRAVNDLWFDSDDGNLQFRWDGSNWVPVGDGRITANATAITNLTTRVSNVEGVNTSQAAAITSLQSTVDSPTTGVAATATAVSGLTTRVTAAESGISAQASQYSALSTTVGGHTASITSQQTSINGLLLKASVTLDSNGYITGWKLNNNGDTGTFQVLADKFEIVKPGSAARLVYSGNNMRVYDSSNVLRVRLGVW